MVGNRLVYMWAERRGLLMHCINTPDILTWEELNIHSIKLQLCTRFQSVWPIPTLNFDATNPGADNRIDKLFYSVLKQQHDRRANWWFSCFMLGPCRKGGSSNIRVNNLWISRCVKVIVHQQAWKPANCLASYRVTVFFQWTPSGEEVHPTCISGKQHETDQRSHRW